MKKFYILMVALLLGTTVFSQAVFEEDFQAGTMPSTFLLYNDANTPHANIASLFPDAWSVIEDPNDATNFVAASPSWFTSAVIADRWMVTPAITVGPNMDLKWTARAQDPDYKDGYTVKISTTGMNKTDFTTDAFTIASEQATNTGHTYNLANFNGQTIYVAFIQNSTDMFYIIVDDIGVGNFTGIEETASVETTVSLYPNPCTDQLKVTANSAIQTLKVVNALGQVVMEQTCNNAQVTLDVTSLQSGLHYVTGTTATGTFTEKVMVR